MTDFNIDNIEAAVKDFAEGKFVIVVDDEDRENEGDLIIAAEKITPEKVNFMLKHARGSVPPLPSAVVKNWICPIRSLTIPRCLARRLR